MTSNQHDKHRRKRLFEIGALEFSEGVERLMNEGRLDPMPLFERHMRGDWGDVADSEDIRPSYGRVGAALTGRPLVDVSDL